MTEVYVIDAFWEIQIADTTFKKLTERVVHRILAKATAELKKVGRLDIGNSHYDYDDIVEINDFDFNYRNQPEKLKGHTTYRAFGLTLHTTDEPNDTDFGVYSQHLRTGIEARINICGISAGHERYNNRHINMKKRGELQ